MKVAYELLVRHYSTFKKLTPQEQNLWKKLQTYNIYRFLTGKPAMVQEFHFNWMTIQDSKDSDDWTGELMELFGQANTEGIHLAI
jgi:hypothetical protein